MKFKYYNSDFASCTEKEFSGFCELEGAKGEIALKQYLTAFFANMRQGNACTKDRGDVAGSGKKPYRQKGTGMARHGEKRSPIWVGGGVVFGPKPRDYSQKVNKSVKRLALLRALWDKIQENGLAVVEELKAESGKTRDFAQKLDRAFDAKNILFIDTIFDEMFVRASGNISRVFFAEANSVNPFDLISAPLVLVSERSMDVLIKRTVGADVL